MNGGSMAKSTIAWSDIKPVVAGMNQTELVVLVRDLFRISSENRVFLAARLLPEADAGLEEYRQRIIEQFRTRHSFPPLKLGEARKAIREYRKATSDINGTLDLMMTYLEAGTECTLEYGDLDESFYTSLISMMEGTEKILLDSRHHDLIRDFLPRLRHLEARAYNVAHGYDDAVAESVERIAAAVEEE
jgi:hypothetical protein